MLSAHHANRQVATPEDLSCFTPSPVPSSPSAPSPVLPRFAVLKLVRVSTDSPFPRTVLISSPRLLSPEAPYHGLHRKYSKLITSLVEYDCESLKLDIRSRKSEIMDDIMDTLASQMLEDLEIGTIHQRLNHFLPIFASWLFLYYALQLSFFRMTKQALLYLLLIQEVLPGLELAYLDSAIRKFVLGLRLSDITTTNDVGGGAGALEVSFTQRWSVLVVTFSGIIITVLKQRRNPRVRRSESCDNIRGLISFRSEFFVDWEKLVYELLEEKHNPPVRRSKSCESIRSSDSFLPDPVVNWEDLIYGYNR